MSTITEHEQHGQPTVDVRPFDVWHIASRLFSSHQVHAVLCEVVSSGRALMGSDAAAVLLYDRDRDRFVPAVPSVAPGLDERWLQGRGLEAAQSLAAQAMQARAVREVLDTATTPDLQFPLLAGGWRPGSVCVTPLDVEGRTVGVLGLYAIQPRTSPSDTATLRSFAALAGLAIANAQAYERQRQLRARLEALDEASKALAAELAPGAVLQRIVEIAAALVGARYGALGVVGADGLLIEFITTGITPEERALIGPLPRGHGVLGVLIQQGQPVRIDDIQQDPRRVGFPPHHPPMRSLLGVPIRAHNAVVGDLYLADKIEGPAFSDDDQHLVEMLAAHAGIAIENARLYGELGDLSRLRERERIARDLHDGIIQDIYGATLQLEDVAEDVIDAAAQGRLLAIAEQLRAVIGDVRTYIQGLRARELQGRLLAEGIAELVRDAGARGELQAELRVEGTLYRVPDEQANTVLQIAREALSNAIKHAQATSVRARLSYEREGVTLSIADNGRGFDPAAGSSQGHFGLQNLRSRAEEIGGCLAVISAPGAGATITAFIPARAP